MPSWCLISPARAVISPCLRSWRNIKKPSLTWLQSALAARYGVECGVERVYPWLLHVHDGCVPLFLEARSFILLRQMIKDIFAAHDLWDVLLRSV